MLFEVTIDWDVVNKRGVKTGTWCGDDTRYPCLQIVNDELIVADAIGDIIRAPVEMFKYARPEA